MVGTPDERLLGVLQKMAPGTPLRDGIDRIIKASKGAIIVLGYDDTVEPLISGGFKMETKFTSQRLSEVAKMDGAIVLDSDVQNIRFANVHLVPDHGVSTTETGTRHRTAERAARQTGKPVISVSESMRVVTLYFDDTKHVFDDANSLLFRANQALSTLERYRTRLDEVSANLSSLELEHVVTLRDVMSVLQRGEMVRRIADEIEVYITELGVDGRLLQLQLDELMAGVERERVLIVRDYLPDRRRRLESILTELDRVPTDELLDTTRLADALGFDHEGKGTEQSVEPRGYRLLSRIPRLPESIVNKIVDRFGSLGRLRKATLDELDDVEGVGETRAMSIKDGLRRLEEKTLLDRFTY